MPTEATSAAMPLPIVPAPTTPTRLIRIRFPLLPHTSPLEAGDYRGLTRTPLHAHPNAVYYNGSAWPDCCQG